MSIWGRWKIGAAALAGALCLAGCSESTATTVTYENADAYSEGGAALSETITDIEIHWEYGDVSLLAGEGTTLSFSETSDSSISDEQSLRYLVDGTTLLIEPCASDTATDLDKDLTLIVPAGSTLESVTVDSNNGGVSVDGVGAESLTVSTYKGSIRVSSSQENAAIDLESVHGDIVTSFVTLPVKMSLSDTSGNITLQVPSQSDMVLNFSTTSGQFTSSIPCAQNGSVYTYGTGGTQYDVSTVTGDVTVVSTKDSTEE